LCQATQVPAALLVDHDVLTVSVLAYGFDCDEMLSWSSDPSLTAPLVALHKAAVALMETRSVAAAKTRLWAAAATPAATEPLRQLPDPPPVGLRRLQAHDSGLALAAPPAKAKASQIALDDAISCRLASNLVELLLTHRQRSSKLDQISVCTGSMLNQLVALLTNRLQSFSPGTVLWPRGDAGPHGWLQHPPLLHACLLNPCTLPSSCRTS